MGEYRRRLMGASRKGSTVDMSNYMTIEALEDGLTAKLTRTACEYSIDGGEWVSLAANTSTPAINTGHIISFKANNPSATSTYGIGTFTITKQCNLKGNCMSMLAYDDAASMTTVKQYGFRRLFQDCTTIVNVEKSFLPATTFNSYCCYQMFYGCSALTNAPDLPATALGNYCCYRMFQNCYSLETPPELPATTLASYCYQDMFAECVNLKEAPLLPAKSTRLGCYRGMFYDCHSLENAPKLEATIISDYAYYQMFYGCSNLVNPPVAYASNLGERACHEMFYGCTSLISTPSMDIKSVSSYSCYGMFQGCTNLTSIWVNISASYFYNGSCYCMFQGCTKLESASSLFALKSDSVLGVGCFDSMFYSCINLTTPPSIPSLNLAENCYSDMFRYCSSLKSVPELPATTLAQDCYYRMFYDCKKIESVVLPAIELVEGCYGNMFYGCSNLRDIKALFLTTPSTTYTNQWVYGVYQYFGTFTKNKDATWDVSGENGIPNGWTVVTE